MRRILALIATTALSVPLAGGAVIPEFVPDLPVLGQQAYRGNDLITSPAPAVAPTVKVADGDPSEWTGTITRYGGTAIYSAGEYVYQDYIGDDWGADDGADFRRAEITDQLNAVEPRTYRVEALSQALGEQFGADGPGEVVSYAEYGNVEGGDPADIEEVRIAADESSLHLLVRTVAMAQTNGTAVVVLLDTAEGGSYGAPGGITTGAEYALVAIGNQLTEATHLGAAVAPPPAVVASNPDDPGDAFVNTIEISLDRAALGLPQTFGIGVATALSTDGATIASVKSGDAQSDLVNVAFRFDEPTRIWMDHDQAFALMAGDIDAYLARIDLAKLTSGYSEAFAPRPGYYERVYVSDSPVNRESNSGSYSQGPWQHYGLYLPTAYREGRSLPATWWTHYRGGHAHDAAAWVPGLIRQLGEARDNIVITPGARGTSTWYVGRGHEDFLDVWDDSMASFPIDPDRVYMSGYSMGGYASWLLPLVYPDRFAGAFPTAGPPTQGLWLGVDEGAGGANGGRALEQLTFDIIGNAANLGYVIYQGSSDELVPFTGPTRMASQLALNGYRYRLYLFPGAEHYTNAIIDDWREAAAYLDGFRRDPNPPRVVYTVKPSLELATEQVSVPDGAVLDYTFDGAFWVDGLTTRAGALDDAATLGTIDATTFGRGVEQHATVPEAGTLGQPEAYVMAGQRWVPTGYLPPENRFTATLTNLATATLDLAGMGLETTEPLTATIISDGPASVRLIGTWPTPMQAQCSNACTVTSESGAWVFDVQQGTTTITFG